MMLSVPTNRYDHDESALIEMSRMQRAVWRDRWEEILIAAGENDLAAKMKAEAQRETHHVV